MNTVNVKVLHNGPRYALLLVYLKCDGETGDLENETLITPVELGLPAAARLRLQEITYNFAGFDAVVSFASGGVEPNVKWVLAESSNHPVDFAPYGTLVDDSGMDGTCELQISTTGFTTVTDQGSILMKLRKP